MSNSKTLAEVRASADRATVRVATWPKWKQGLGPGSGAMASDYDAEAATSALAEWCPHIPGLTMIECHDCTRDAIRAIPLTEPGEEREP